MLQKLRLMCVLAHPDDESLGTGGILARYSNEGIATFLVTATRGEKGRYGLAEKQPGPDVVGREREAELRKAARVLGVQEVSIFNYGDGNLDKTPPEELVRTIASQIRRVRPDVVVTFGPDGAYGHPDHIAISQGTAAAVVSAADQEFETEPDSAPHRVSKLYFLAWDEGKWRNYQHALKKLAIKVDGHERQAVPWPDWAITTRVDTAEHWETVRRAVLCHQTQVAIFGQLADLPEAEHVRLWGTQEFYRVFSLVNGGRRTETDLFEGLRQSEPARGAEQEQAERNQRLVPVQDRNPSDGGIGTTQGDGGAHGRNASLDMPAAQFRRLGHLLVDQISDFLISLPGRKVARQSTPSDIRSLLTELESRFAGHDSLEEVLPKVASQLFDQSLHNGHPRFWGYITSSAAPIGMLGDLLAAAVNSNVGAWKLSPVASEMEMNVVRQIAQLLDFPSDCGGLLVSGGNMANFVGLLTARYRLLGPDVRTRGIGAFTAPLRVYVSRETHTWVQKAVDLAGLGTESIRWIQTDSEQRLDLSALERQIEMDLAQGDRPFLVVGNAGTVSTGAVDPLEALSRVCRKYDLWLHVDGAYGAPAAALPDASPDLKALRLADSVAVDPHKWLYVPLEAGCILVRDKNTLRSTFSYHPPYYHFDEECTNFFDFGPQNSRSFRALKIWLVLQSAGSDGLRKMIAEDIRLAEELFRLIESSEDLVPLAQGLSITAFRYVPERLKGESSEDVEEYLNELNRELLVLLERSGEVFISNAIVDGKFALRLCVVNFRTSSEDIRALPDIVRRHGRIADRDLSTRLS